METGRCIIFSAPSGAGKTTIVRHLVGKMPQLEFSISACSRPMRPAEKEGVDYYFLSAAVFREKISAGEFVEWEEVYSDSYYGTLKTELERIWKKGNCAIFDVDVVGGINLKQLFGPKALSIFIQPPSLRALEERLIKRGTETPESLLKRLNKAGEELEKSRHFDAIVVNDDLDIAKAETEQLVREFLYISS